MSTFTYDVALSFADEQRSEAHQLAESLSSDGYRVFYDKWEEHRMLGQSLTIRLTEVYEHEARYCVILVSEAYVDKDYPRHELQAALSRHVKARGDYILPIHYDDARLPGLPGDTVYLDRRKVSLADATQTLRRRLGPPPPTVVLPLPSDPGIRVYPSGYILIVIVKGGAQGLILNFDCHLTNRRERPVTLRHLEARFTDPNGAVFPLSWNLFYAQSGRRQSMTGLVRPVTLPTNESQLTGIQFTQAASLRPYRWLTPGTCRLHLFGLVERDGKTLHSDLGTGLEIDLRRDHLQYIDYWSHAPDRVWEKDVDDPDNAVGIPLVVENVESTFGH